MKLVEKQRRGLHASIERLSIRRLLTVCLLTVIAASSAQALEPGRRISQFGHTAWRIQDSLISSAIAITQTTDGYIWIAGSSGLMRFDGVRFVKWTPPKGITLNGGFSYLLGARDGSLWVGLTSGLLRLKDGQVQSYTNPEGSGITAIMEARDGTIWVTRYRLSPGEGPLCRVEGKDLHCFGKADGIPVTYGLGLTEDTEGNIWFGSEVLCRWRPGSVATYFDNVLKPRRVGGGVIDVAAGPSGSVWASIDGVGPELGVRYFSGGKWASYVVPGFDGSLVRSHTLYIDHKKSLWVGTENQGLFHIEHGEADHYGTVDGLSGNSISSIYEDAEGNLWVTTDGGIDVFRDTAVVSFSMQDGLSASDIRSILALRDNSVLFGNEGALDILRDDHVLSLRAGRGLPGQDVEAMFQDHSGTVWMGIDDKLMTYEDGHFREIKNPDGSAVGLGGNVIAITEDVDHNIWAFSDGKHVLLRIADRSVKETIPLSGQFRRTRSLAADRDGGIWLAANTFALAHYRDGHMDEVPLTAGPVTGVIRDLFVDSDNALWVSTSRGLFQWKNNQAVSLDTRNGLPCNSVFSAIKDNEGALWLYALCGLLKIDASDLSRWLREPESHLEVKVFDALDGVQAGLHSMQQPKASKAPDGRLWFASGLLAQMVDPYHTYGNKRPPPVHIEEIIADHKVYEPGDAVRIPPLTRDLQIDYTALSFTVPQKVSFRYKLEGHDTEWQDPGTRRQAFYMDLRPGNYQFHVIASNNNGVWNNVGDSVDFSVAPAWYQTNWFTILCAVTGALMIWLLYQLRVRQIAVALSARFDERLAERTRLARDLHDTFLQTIQGSKMVADDALDDPTDAVRMRRAIVRLSEWLEQATQEGRAALNSLRTSTTLGNDLAEAFQRAIDDCLIRTSMKATFTVEGISSEMHPIVRDEIYRIGYEAIHNAMQHSGASRLEMQLRYSHDLILIIHDNGKGIDPETVEKGKGGHFGLQGMRERAMRIGGKLTIVASADSGTRIELIVPGNIVFRGRKPKPSTMLARVRNFFSRAEQTSHAS